MEVKNLTFQETTLQRAITQDYLSHKPELQPFYQFNPDYQGALKAAEDRNNDPVNRERLVNVLTRQYQNLQSDFFDINANKAVAANVNALKDEKTFTITTGHQLNIFGGPLYYLYKIASTISLAKKLNNLYPSFNFVPVYWMGAEDHDFEEINHFHLFNDTYKWDREIGGSVGRMDPSGLSHLLDQLKANINEKEAFEPLEQIWRKAFSEFPTLATATQYWVHEVFKEHGLLVLDPSSPELKDSMISIFEDDIFNHTNYDLVSQNKSKLDQYELPVNPRSINVFYVKDGLRERIVENNEGFEVLDQNIQFSATELKDKLHHSPEMFSPNVVLRPLYQQKVLPNISYIGGTNEIAYWFELKSLFSNYEVFFPQLIVRNSALWIGKGIRKKLNKFNLNEEDLFLNRQDVIRHYLSEKEDTSTLDAKISKINKDYDELLKLCEKFDDELKWNVVNAAKEHQKDLDKISKDLRKLVKKRNEKEVNQLHKVYDALFPKGIPQERHDNFLPFFLKHGFDWFDFIIDHLNPIERQVLIMED